jgi:hypothetical protein
MGSKTRFGIGLGVVSGSSSMASAIANESAAQLEKDAAALAAQAAETEALVGQARCDAAKANERAAELEKEAELARASIAEANARAAEANQRAQEAALELAKFKAPRSLTIDRCWLEFANGGYWGDA